jgi:hypothetical protein
MAKGFNASAAARYTNVRPAIAARNGIVSGTNPSNPPIDDKATY